MKQSVWIDSSKKKCVKPTNMKNVFKSFGNMRCKIKLFLHIRFTYIFIKQQQQNQKYLESGKGCGDWCLLFVSTRMHFSFFWEESWCKVLGKCKCHFFFMRKGYLRLCHLVTEEERQKVMKARGGGTSYINSPGWESWRSYSKRRVWLRI